MNTQTESREQATSYEPVSLVPAEVLTRHADEITEAITARAYELFEKRGCAPGHEWEDWLHAEAEFLRPVATHVDETDTAFTVLAQVLGFGGDELQVGVGPNCVIIAGKKKSLPEFTGTKNIYIDVSPDEVLKTVLLPSPVDPATAVAKVHGGLLEVDVSKFRSGDPCAEYDQGGLYSECG